MNVLIIRNPIAGGMRAEGRMKALTAALQRQGHTVEIYQTTAGGDARRRAAEVGPSVDRLIVAGGDGTLNEVLNGLVDPTRTPLAQFPMGTANLLAKELALPRDPEAIAAMVDHGSIRRLDMGLVGDRRFLLVVSAGFDAMVTQDIHNTRRGALGYRGYLLPIWRTMMRYKTPRLRVTIEPNGNGRSSPRELDGAMVIVSKTKHYGGLFTINDDARFDSGHLDVCVLRRGSLANLIGYSAAAMTGRLSRLASVVHDTASRLRIESDDPVAVEVDGDYLGTTPIHISVQPGAVPMVVPA